MLPLNAIDAIAPAFARTHETLFAPFRMGRSWKLAASQYLGLGGSAFYPIGLMLLFVPASMRESMGPAYVGLLAAAAIFTAISLVAIYFCGRMELVDFEMLVTRGQFVAPMWRHYSQRIWPWLGWKILVGTLTFGALGGLLFVAARRMFMPFMSMLPSAQPNSEQLSTIFAAMFGFYAIFFLVFFLMKIPSTLIADFVMPFFILEDISFTAALARGWHVFQADPVGVLLYLICKPVFFMIGFICQYMATGVFIFLLEMVVIAFGALGYFVFWRNAGPVEHVLLIATAVVFGLCLYACMIYLMMGTMGYLCALLNAYAIYFLAGRYPLLGNLLEPGPGAPFTPPPVFPSPDERKDDDGGPPMPMNPAVA